MSEKAHPKSIIEAILEQAKMVGQIYNYEIDWENGAAKIQPTFSPVPIIHIQFHIQNEL